MWVRLRRNPKTLAVVSGVVLISMGLVTLSLWRNDHQPSPGSHHHHHLRYSVNGMNLTKFIDGPRQLTLQPRKVLSLCAGEGQSAVEVLVVVPTSPHNLAARSAIRESWGAYLPSTWALVFYVGAVGSASVQESLAAEAQAHQDIAQDSTFSDSYANLTLKTVALTSWAHRACPKASFLFKVDDDVFVNVPKLHKLVACLGTAMRVIYTESRNAGSENEDCGGVRSLVSYYTDATTHSYESYVLAGYTYHTKPYRDPTSKWYVPESAYPKDDFPPFLSGTAYLVSGNVLPHLLEGARNTPAINLEDVYLTGLVASEQLKLRLGKLDGMERFRPRFGSVCAYKTLLTAHGFTPGELRETTHEVFGVEESACEGLLTRIGLAVNSAITSIFPRLPSSDSRADADVVNTI